ncbi:MAG: amidohydrolase [Flavipsychrobacter sp.]|nr:amidohydrolase [Flavipsychrobacter sp.]
MPFLTAKQIHDGNCWLPEGSVIEVSDDGVIISVLDTPVMDAVFYEGVLAPGFVNAHCHLELSHMKGLVPTHTGLIPFLKNIPQHRNDYIDDQKRMARNSGHDELVRNGIVAVGDIANTNDTMDVRSLDKLHFYTFVESIGFTEANAERSFGYAVQTYNTFATQQSANKVLKQAIVPHAPYSVSSSLFRLIDMHREDVIISIHNQESEEENKYYTSKEGEVTGLLLALGIDDSFFYPTGRSSIQSYLDWMSQHHPFIFVHNTYTKHLDVQYAHSRLNEVYWCLCPNANMYIENKLPDINMFISEEANICIGTDSLASNHQLCILSELYTIKEHYPALSWELLLSWGTRNGAQALQMQHTIGTIEPGKTPGIIQLTGLDTANAKPLVKRII